VVKNPIAERRVTGGNRGNRVEFNSESVSVTSVTSCSNKAFHPIANTYPKQTGEGERCFSTPRCKGESVVRALVLIPLALWLGAGTATFAADDRETISAADFKKVDVLTRSALFVAMDRGLSVLRTTEKGPPAAISTIPKNYQLGKYRFVSAVGVAETGDALFVSNRKAIFRVMPTRESKARESNAGESKIILTLDTLRADSLGKDFAKRFDINWFLAAGPGDTLYFALLPAIGKEHRSYVCRYEPTSRRTQVLECQFPTGIDIDRQQGIVYVPPFSNANFAGSTAVLLITRFSDGVQPKRRPLHHMYDWCQLSPDRKTLLLSEAATEKEPHLATLDLSSDRETVFPFSGSYATWGTGGSIYFGRGETSLWTATLGATQPTLLYDLGRSASEAQGSFAAPPVLSRDGSWLAWRWALKGASGPPQRGTVLFDLKNHEYRLLDQSWHAVNWAE
jgi:hypothetical protein